MCGIFGITSNQIRHPGEFYQLASHLLCHSARRGTDAAGFAAIADNQFITDKNNSHPVAFSRLSKEWRGIRNSSALSLIGHTRAATAGSPKININNHPFHGPRYSMVHNGGIFQFRKIAEEQKFNLQSNCDSELILHCVERCHSIRDGITNAFSVLDNYAMMAVSILDRENGDIHLFRNTNSPCTVMRVDRLNAVVFASTTQIILDALTSVFGSLGNTWEFCDLVFYGGQIPSYSHVTIKADGTIKEDDIWSDIRPKNLSGAFGFASAMYHDVGVYSGDKTSNYSSENISSDLDNTQILMVCCECHKPIEDDSYRGAIHETEDGWMCHPCYKYIGEDSCEFNYSDTDNFNLVVPSYFVNKHGDDYLELIADICSSREPKQDYDLDHFSMATYLRFDAMTTEEKVDDWKDMNIRRIHEMNDGEYLAYMEFLGVCLA